MFDVYGIPIRKVIAFILTLIGFILYLVAELKAQSLFFVVVCLTLAYLALGIIMNFVPGCRKRGESSAIEGYLGLTLSIYSILALTTSLSTLVFFAYFMFLSVGAILVLSLLFV